MLALVIQKWSRDCANFRLLALGTLRFFRQLGFVALNRPVSMSAWRCAWLKAEPWEAQFREALSPKWELYIYPWNSSPERTISCKCETTTVAVSKSTFPMNIQKIPFLLLTSQPQKSNLHKQNNFIAPTKAGPGKHPNQLDIATLLKYCPGIRATFFYPWPQLESSKKRSRRTILKKYKYKRLK